MKALLQRHAARFDALSVRERLLVFAAALAIVGFALQALLIEPALRQSAQLREQLAQQTKTLDALRSTRESLLAARSDPDAATRARIAEHRKSLGELSARIDAVAQGLVPPERMPHLLQRLLGTDARLAVVELRSLAPSPLTEKSLPPDGAQATSPAGGCSSTASNSPRRARTPTCIAT